MFRRKKKQGKSLGEAIREQYDPEVGWVEVDLEFNVHSVILISQHWIHRDDLVNCLIEWDNDLEAKGVIPEELVRCYLKSLAEMLLDDSVAETVACLYLYPKKTS